MPIIKPYKGIMPKIDPSAFIADNVVIVGDVEIGPDSNIWYGTVMRGDVNRIRIGARTNIQDGTVIHVSSFGHDTLIGDDVTIGHMALIHACHIHDGGFVGMQSCVMDGAVVESQAMVAAGALVTAGKVIPSKQLWGGRPAKFMRELDEKDLKHLVWSSTHYVRMSKEYMNN
jgi:carbonic anhydrase/acetyltransferase-like protein (isoleucine patch superfamily)